MGQTHFGKLFVKLYFLQEYCVVTMLYMIIYEKHSIFNIAYGEMHDLLDWKLYAFFIKFLGMDFMELLHYLQVLKMFYLDL